jgi:hypothetical protein
MTEYSFSVTAHYGLLLSYALLFLLKLKGLLCSLDSHNHHAMKLCSIYIARFRLRIEHHWHDFRSLQLHVQIIFHFWHLTNVRWCLRFGNLCDSRRWLPVKFNILCTYRDPPCTSSWNPRSLTGTGYWGRSIGFSRPNRTESCYSLKTTICCPCWLSAILDYS